MGLKYFVVVLAVLCAFQLYEAARLVPRSADAGDTAAEPDVLAKAGETISHTLETWRDTLQDLVKQAPSVDTVIANLTTHFQTISDKVETAAHDLVQQINPSTVKP